MVSRIKQIAAKLLRLVVRGGRRIILDPGEAFLILRMAFWVMLLSIIVKLKPLPRALRLIATHTRGASGISVEQTEKTLGRAIDLLLGTNLLIFKPICWKRAAILHRYLALNGITTRIVFGVRKGTRGDVDGHAWLEADGKPLLETAVPNYAVTYIFPSQEPFNLELALLSRDTV
ncbi:MAG: lasso peptide biosynthesis B2 protein [Pyrinomonadaceae bacterium]